MKLIHKLNRNKQQGAVTLVVVMMLLLVMAVVSVTTTRTGMMEQNIVSNDLRAREAQEAAEAGLEYGIAWATENTLTPAIMDCSTTPGTCTLTCPGDAECPTLTTVSGSTSSETYDYSLTYTRSLASELVAIASVSQGIADTNITAQATSSIKQDLNALHSPSHTSSAPPLSIAGCMNRAPTGSPNIYLLDASNIAVVSGTDEDSGSGDCLDEGHFETRTWTDSSDNGVQESSETGGSTSYTTDLVVSCGGSLGTNCMWNEYFDIAFADAKQLVYDAQAAEGNHIFTDSTDIICGEPQSEPSIYILRNRGPINTGDITTPAGGCPDFSTGRDTVDGDKTIGTPEKPVIIIVPGDNTDAVEIAQDTSASGGDVPGDYECPKLNGGITIFGIVYYESAACAAQGWGGATIYGSVIVEGNYDKPNANSNFIEVDYAGAANNFTFISGVNYATRIPGTWNDFN